MQTGDVERGNILLVDDEENILEQMRSALEAEYDVFTASSESEAVTTFERERTAVVTLFALFRRRDWL